MDQQYNFAAKVAVITGAGAGFGKAFAEALSARGAAVVLLDVDVAAAMSVAGDIQAKGGRALAISCDVADEDSMAEAVTQTLEVFGGVDLLINNAGLHSTEYNKGFGDLGLAKARRLFDVNVFGVVVCSLACRAAMAARGGGAILNIASVAGYKNTNAYGVSKLAVRGLTASLAAEFSSDAIRVNAIAPGLIATDKIKADMPPEFFTNYAQNLQLIHRTGEPEDIVQAMLFLCSDNASFITGETLRVSGGNALFV